MGCCWSQPPVGAPSLCSSIGSEVHQHYRALCQIQDDDRSCGETVSEPCGCCVAISGQIRILKTRFRNGSGSAEETYLEHHPFPANARLRVVQWIDDEAVALTTHREELVCPVALYEQQQKLRVERRHRTASSDRPLPKRPVVPKAARPKTPPPDVMAFGVGLAALVPPAAPSSHFHPSDSNASRSSGPSRQQRRRSRSRQSARSGAAPYSAESESLSLSLQPAGAILLPPPKMDLRRSPNSDVLSRAYQYQLHNHVASRARCERIHSRQRSIASALEFTASAESSMTELNSEMSSIQDEPVLEPQFRVGSPRTGRGHYQGDGGGSSRRAARFSFPQLPS